MYCFTQILAGIMASFSYALLFWDAFNLGPSKGFGWCLAYVAFELVGAALAAGAFVLVRPGDFDQQGDSATSELVSEFLGTFFLVLTVGLNVLGNSPAGAFSIAASLMCMIY